MSCKGELFFSGEVLDPRLFLERGGTRFAFLCIDEPSPASSACIFCAGPFIVRLESPGKVIGDARVERSIAASQDIDKPGFHC